MRNMKQIGAIVCVRYVEQGKWNINIENVTCVDRYLD